MPDFDDWIDAQLRNVPVPRDLHARLRATRTSRGNNDDDGAGPLDDERLDAMLCDVRVPARLERRLRLIPRSHWPAPGMWAAAASILILIGGSAYWVASRRVLNDGHQDQVASRAARPAPATPPVESIAQAPRTRKTARPPRLQTPVTVRLGQDAEQPEPPGGVLDNVANVGNSLRQAIEARLRANSALGSGGQLQRLPALDVLESPVARGVSPPRVRGYDLLFQLKHGEHPWVVPAASASLKVSRVPFSFRTSSYDQAVDSIASGRLPEASDVRVEDFLAAQQYVLPPAPAARVVLHAAGCPSPLGKNGSQLLQFAVQAGPSAQAQHAATRLVAVVETSAAMQAGARSKTMLRALGKLAAQMGPLDRLTVIGFSEAPSVIAENATRADVLSFLASGSLKGFGGSANALAAIRAACETADALPANETRRLLFVTTRDGAFEGDERAKPRSHSNSWPPRASPGTSCGYRPAAIRLPGRRWRDMPAEKRPPLPRPTNWPPRPSSS